MIKSKRLMLILFCLLVGIALGLIFSEWTGITAAEVEDKRHADTHPAAWQEASAAGEAVPAAAHLSLWEEDTETLIPFITRGQ